MSVAAGIATTAEQRTAQIMHASTKVAARFIVHGRREQALLVMLASVQKQAAVNGVRCELLP